MKKILVFLPIVFMTIVSAFADMTCSETRYHAVYDAHAHTCDTGEFLPANYDGCVACPANATCNGGTFYFNENKYYGMTMDSVSIAQINKACANNFPKKLSAQYDRNQYTCNPGYYVPANTDGCVVCPANSYCPGGTYTFNETLDQGITACATGLYAPTGMWESAQCGHILHIGENVLYLRSTKKTTHALHFAVGGNEFFFANATTADVPMHAGTNRRLKIKFNDVVYSIYDDTVVVPE